MKNQFTVNPALSLSTCFALSEYAQIFVPSTVNINERIDSSEMLHLVKREMSKRFGGATTYNVVDGSWYSDTLSSLVDESVKIVHSWANEIDEESENFIISLAAYVKDEMSQESVMIVLCRLTRDEVGKEKQIVKAYLV